MQYRKFGKTGETVSALGFGCMRLPILNEKSENIDVKRAEEMLNYAYDHGVTYFDTAYVYHRPMHQGISKGFSEDVLGNCFQGAKREKIFYATKLPTFVIQSPDEFEKTLHESLTSLKTDRIDFYLAHSLTKQTWDRMIQMGMLEFLQKAKESGKVRHLGFSFHDELPVFKEIVDSFDWEFAQIQYNYLDVRVQAGTEGLHYAASKNLGMVIMEPLRGGKLAVTPTEEVRNIWKKSQYDRSMAQRGLMFVWDDPAVSVVLSGMSTLDQVKENVRSADSAIAGTLSDFERSLYAEARKAYWNRTVVPCTGCEYCLPCPAGVNIPSNLNIVNELAMFGDVTLSKGNYEFQPPSERSENCVQCGVCLTKCPQHIQIPDHLQKLTEQMK